jgi:hypothetical protein
MSMGANDPEHAQRAAYRAAGRAVAAALLGFTIRSVGIHSVCDESGNHKPTAAMALKESNATFEEQAFMDLAGTWAELEFMDCRSQPSEARRRILDSFQTLYPGIDPQKTRYGLAMLIDGYQDSVRALADEFLRTKSMSGTACGKIIMAYSGIRNRTI